MFDDFAGFLANLPRAMRARIVPGILYRKGGDRLDWSEPGDITYVPVAQFVQIGALSWTGAAADKGLVTQVFPAAYYGEPIVFVNVRASSPAGAFVITKNSSNGLGITINWKADLSLTELHFAWIAYGGALLRG